MSLLSDALAGAEPSALERVWLRVPEDLAAPMSETVHVLFPPALP